MIAGSFNYTQPANDYNDKNLFVLGSGLPKVDQITVDKAACQALAQQMKAEIESMSRSS